jgi:Thiolase-like protein type 1 additional C-terminal domain
MTRQLRTGNKGKHGLILANGGVITYQHVICLSSQPRRDGSPYPAKNPLPETIQDVLVPPIDAQPEGEAVIEVIAPFSHHSLRLTTLQTYTVEFNRDGTPKLGHIVGRLKKTGHRFLANHADERTLKQLCSTTEEPIGRTGHVGPDGKTKGRNLFGFSSGKQQQSRL